MNHNLIKKLLFWIGIAVLVFSLVIFRNINLTYKTDSPYKYEGNQSGDFVEISITLNKYGVAIVERKVNGVHTDTTTFEYTVINGILYQSYTFSNYEIQGTADASKIVLAGNNPFSTLVFENNATTITNTILIMLIILSINGIGISFYLEKKKYKTITEQKTELLDKID